MNVIGICGVAGSGKDTIADYLVANYGYVKVALADPMKRIAQQVYGFTDEQLWGASEKRNAVDRRYLRTESDKHGWVCDTCLKAAFGTTQVESITLGRIVSTTEEGCASCHELVPVNSTTCLRHPPVFLTPRFALQKLGTEWGRLCFEDTWIHLGLTVAEQLLKNEFVMYTAQEGVVPVIEQCEMGDWRRYDAPSTPYRGVVFSDIRFLNEVDAIRAVGGRTWRLTRGTLLKGDETTHASETELLGIPADKFTSTLNNTGSLEETFRLVDSLM